MKGSSVVPGLPKQWRTPSLSRTSSSTWRPVVMDAQARRLPARRSEADERRAPELLGQEVEEEEPEEDDVEGQPEVGPLRRPGRLGQAPVEVDEGEGEDQRPGVGNVGRRRDGRGGVAGGVVVADDDNHHDNEGEVKAADAPAGERLDP